MQLRILGRLQRVRELARSKLLANVGITGFNFAAQLFTQMGLFILMTRALGASGYGTFASVTAITLLVSSFVGWGTDQLLVKSVATDHGVFPRFFGSAIIFHLATALPLMAVLWVAFWLLDIGHLGVLSLAAIIAADMLFGRLTWLCVMCSSHPCLV